MNKDIAEAGKATQFQPGQSGNPNGRPKKLPKLDKLLDDVLGEEKDDTTAMQAILMNLRAIATGKQGSVSVRAAEILLDRAYGKARQPIDANLNLINLDSASEEVKKLVAEFGLLGAKNE